MKTLSLIILTTLVMPSQEGDARELHEAGARLVKEGNLEGAIQKFREVLDLQPEWVQVRYDLAKLAFQVGMQRYIEQVEISVQATQARLESRDEESEALWAEAKRLGQEADAFLEEAKENLERVTTSEIEDDLVRDAYMTLGHVHAFAGRWKEAREAYVKAMNLTPEGKPRDVIQRAIDRVDKEIEASRR
jgi:Flp pilus assembly protein TadD